MSKRRYRVRREDSDDDVEAAAETEEETHDEQSGGHSKKVKLAKDIQKSRKRSTGVSAVGLALGKKLTEEEKLSVDPFKLKTGGGLVSLQDLATARADGQLDDEEDEVVKRLSSTFSAETKRRDDEERMLKYIDEEMKKSSRKEELPGKSLSMYEEKIRSLYKVPDWMQVDGKKTTEEMLSNQMLSGIPEVDLGLEAKFRNIEETEMAKQNALTAQGDQQGQKTSFAVTNYASNYTHHSLRFFKEKDMAARAAKQPPKPEGPTYVAVVGEEEPELKFVGTKETAKKKTDPSQNATDDMHFDRYRKKFKY